MADDKERILGMELNEGLPPSKTMDSVGYDSFSGVPKSHGFPPLVVWFGAVCLLAIFAVGGWTLADSNCSHVWPWTEAAKINLENSAASASTTAGPFGSCYDQH